MNNKLKLSNGVMIPQIGLGTWLIDDSKVCETVLNALEIGYRHIDTAEAYQNERGVGEALKKTNIKREDIFLQTKLVAECKNYEEAKKCIDESFNKLGVDYIDLMIIHCPQPWAEFRNGKHYEKGNLEAWEALTEYYKAGKIKAIGVSNFEIYDLENIINNSDVKPMVNQILTHIGNTDFELIKYCKEHDIVVEAYSPIAHGALLKNDLIENMAKKYEVSIAQLCIRYTLQLGLVSLPKSENKDHIKSNFDVDFVISDEDMGALCDMDKIHTYGKADVFPCYNKQMKR